MISRMLYVLSVVIMLCITPSYAVSQPAAPSGLPRSKVYDAERRPNIVWFIMEDTGPDFGCYDEPQSHTPNFDQLADQGVRYTNVFSATPVCGSNRSALMTGMHAPSIDAQHFRSHETDGYRLPEGVRIVTDWLRPAGYTTGLIWKQKTHFQFKYDGRAGKEKPYDTSNLSKLFNQEPFFAQVQVGEAHRGFHGPEKADPEKVDIPPYYPDHPVVRKDWARYLDSISVADRRFGKLLDQLEEAGVRDHTMIIVTSDHGRAMLRGKDFLYDSGVHVPMIVQWPKSMRSPAFYGEGKVDRRLISQMDITATTLWAAGVKPPMTMQSRVFLGERARRLASLSTNEEVDHPVHRRFVFSAQGRYGETEVRTRTVRTRTYRYIRNWHPERPYFQRHEYKERSYPTIHLMRKLFFEGELTPVQKKYMKPDRPAEELFYIPDDPHNVRNLVNSDEEKHQQALRRLRAALDTWVMETNDHQRFPEREKKLRTKHKNRDDPSFKKWAKNHPEKYRRFRKLMKYWNRIDDDDDNYAYRKRVWGDDNPFPLIELEDPIDEEELPEENLFE